MGCSYSNLSCLKRESDNISSSNKTATADPYNTDCAFDAAITNNKQKSFMKHGFEIKNKHTKTKIHHVNDIAGEFIQNDNEIDHNVVDNLTETCTVVEKNGDIPLSTNFQSSTDGLSITNVEQTDIKRIDISFLVNEDTTIPELTVTTMDIAQAKINEITALSIPSINPVITKEDISYIESKLLSSKVAEFLEEVVLQHAKNLIQVQFDRKQQKKVADIQNISINEDVQSNELARTKLKLTSNKRNFDKIEVADKINIDSFKSVDINVEFSTLTDFTESVNPSTIIKTEAITCEIDHTNSSKENNLTENIEKQDCVDKSNVDILNTALSGIVSVSTNEATDYTKNLYANKSINDTANLSNLPKTTSLIKPGSIKKQIGLEKNLQIKKKNDANSDHSSASNVISTFSFTENTCPVGGEAIYSQPVSRNSNVNSANLESSPATISENLLLTQIYPDSIATKNEKQNKTFSEITAKIKNLQISQSRIALNDETNLPRISQGRTSVNQVVDNIVTVNDHLNLIDLNAISTSLSKLSGEITDKGCLDNHIKNTDSYYKSADDNSTIECVETIDLVPNHYTTVSKLVSKNYNKPYINSYIDSVESLGSAKPTENGEKIDYSRENTPVNNKSNAQAIFANPIMKYGSEKDNIFRRESKDSKESSNTTKPSLKKSYFTRIPWVPSRATSDSTAFRSKLTHKCSNITYNHEDGKTPFKFINISNSKQSLQRDIRCRNFFGNHLLPFPAMNSSSMHKQRQLSGETQIIVLPPSESETESETAVVNIVPKGAETRKFWNRYR